MDPDRPVLLRWDRDILDRDDFDSAFSVFYVDDSAFFDQPQHLDVETWEEMPGNGGQQRETTENAIWVRVNG